MTSFRILSSFECFLRYFQTEWSVVFILQCEFFTSCNISNNASRLVSARIGEGGWSTKCGQAWTGQGEGMRGGGGGSQKFPNLCGHPLWMTPTGGRGTYQPGNLCYKQMLCRLINLTCMEVYSEIALSAVDHLCKKLRLRCFDRVLSTPLI